jgi:hypothetical protein
MAAWESAPCENRAECGTRIREFQNRNQRNEMRKRVRHPSISVLLGILIAVLGSFAAAANFDRMATAELFLKRVYPDVFGRMSGYEVMFVDADPTMTNRFSELTLNVREIPARVSSVGAAGPVPPSPQASALVQRIVCGDDASEAEPPSLGQAKREKSDEQANCPGTPAECAVHAEVTFTLNGKIKRFSVRGRAILDKYESWAEKEDQPLLSTDAAIAAALLAAGAKYPPDQVDRLRQHISVDTLSQLTACNLDLKTLTFEGYDEHNRTYQGGHFVPKRTQILWRAMGKPANPREQGEVCWAEFEPFEGHLFSIK